MRLALESLVYPGGTHAERARAPFVVAGSHLGAGGAARQARGRLTSRLVRRHGRVPLRRRWMAGMHHDRGHRTNFLTHIKNLKHACTVCSYSVMRVERNAPTAGSPYTALYLLSCVGVKGDLVVAGDDELTTQASSAERDTCMHAYISVEAKEGGSGERLFS